MPPPTDDPFSEARHRSVSAQQEAPLLDDPNDASSQLSSVPDMPTDPTPHTVSQGTSLLLWPKQTVAWMHTLADAFGIKFLVMIVFGEHLLKGFVSGSGCSSGAFLVIENLIYLRLQVGAATKSVLMAVSASSWSLKPIFGLINDGVVISGYRRTPWIIFTAVFSTVGYLCIFLFGRHLGPPLLCACFFAVRMQNAWTDLTIEAAYTEKMREHPDHAADILTWVWGGIGVATIVGVMVAGQGLKYVDPFAMAGIGVPVAASIIVPASLGWLGEKRNTSIRFGIHWALLRQQWFLFVCSLALSAVVIVSSVCAIIDISLAWQAIIAVVGSLLVCIVSTVLLPSGLWRPMLFMFLSCAISINTYGFVDNFYLDSATPEESAETGYPVCVDCPHFSNTFYITVVGTLDSVSMMIGSCLFNAYMSQWTYRRALIVTQVLYVFASLVDIVQFQRWNKQFGIPDTVFMLGKHAVQNTCGMLNYMPSAILISKLCPPGVESTVYSLLAGFSNFGMVVSSYLGAYVLQWIGLDEIGKGKVDDFSNAWKACVINACAPIFLIFLMQCLIPDARMTDPLMPQGPVETELKDMNANNMTHVSSTTLQEDMDGIADVSSPYECDSDTRIEDKRLL